MPLQLGEAYCTNAVSIDKPKLYPNTYLAFAHDQYSGEDWMIVRDEPASFLVLQGMRVVASSKRRQVDAQASKRQQDDSSKREFTVFSRFSAS